MRVKAPDGAGMRLDAQDAMRMRVHAQMLRVHAQDAAGGQLSNSQPTTLPSAH